jgi:HD-GYP domain-containing protein (c-di-GMP phosphodiesterase class II)
MAEAGAQRILVVDDNPSVSHRILSVADVYDSLASNRPHRPLISHIRCLELLRINMAEGGLDPAIVEQFCTLMNEETPTPVITHL